MDYSFYGGKPGASFDIKYTYESIDNFLDEVSSSGSGDSSVGIGEYFVVSDDDSSILYKRVLSSPFYEKIATLSGAKGDNGEAPLIRFVDFEKINDDDNDDESVYKDVVTYNSVLGGDETIEWENTEGEILKPYDDNVMMYIWSRNHNDLSNELDGRPITDVGISLVKPKIEFELNPVTTIISEEGKVNTELSVEINSEKTHGMTFCYKMDIPISRYEGVQTISIDDDGVLNIINYHAPADENDSGTETSYVRFKPVKYNEKDIDGLTYSNIQTSTDKDWEDSEYSYLPTFSFDENTYTLYSKTLDSDGETIKTLSSVKLPYKEGYFNYDEESQTYSTVNYKFEYCQIYKENDGSYENVNTGNFDLTDINSYYYNVNEFVSDSIEYKSIFDDSYYIIDDSQDFFVLNDNAIYVQYNKDTVYSGDELIYSIALVPTESTEQTILAYNSIEGVDGDDATDESKDSYDITFSGSGVTDETISIIKPERVINTITADEINEESFDSNGIYFVISDNGLTYSTLELYYHTYIQVCGDYYYAVISTPVKVTTQTSFSSILPDSFTLSAGGANNGMDNIILNEKYIDNRNLLLKDNIDDSTYELTFNKSTNQGTIYGNNSATDTLLLSDITADSIGNFYTLYNIEDNLYRYTLSNQIYFGNKTYSAPLNTYIMYSTIDENDNVIWSNKYSLINNDLSNLYMIDNNGDSSDIDINDDAFSTIYDNYIYYINCSGYSLCPSSVVIDGKNYKFIDRYIAINTNLLNNPNTGLLQFIDTGDDDYSGYSLDVTYDSETNTLTFIIPDSSSDSEDA